VLGGLVARATTPLLPDDYLKLLNPLWSARELRGLVVDGRRETEDSATVTIKPGWGFPNPFGAFAIASVSNPAPADVAGCGPLCPSFRPGGA